MGFWFFWLVLFVGHFVAPIAERQSYRAYGLPVGFAALCRDALPALRLSSGRLFQLAGNFVFAEVGGAATRVIVAAILSADGRAGVAFGGHRTSTVSLDGPGLMGAIARRR